jgi:hypothetical protein
LKQDSAGSGDAAELGIGKSHDLTFKINFISHNFSDNVGGVFVVLGCGCLFALIVAMLEFLWNVKKVAVEQKV